MICGYLKNLLMIGLISIATCSYGQSESFVIECKVSGEFLGATSDSKITNQLIRVSVDSNGAEATVRIEGSGYLNIGTVRTKSGIFDKEQILMTETEKTNYVDKLSQVSINRTTGFINIFVVTDYPRRKVGDMTTASGFCSKVSNKQKF